MISILFLTFLFLGVPAHTERILDTAPLSTSTVALLVRHVQQEYNLADDFYKTLEYESDGFQNIQSEVPNKKGPNGRENSWGVAQINLDSTGHPEITREEALDVRFAVNWAAQQFAAGRAHEWSGWRLIQKKSPTLE